jgi:hypothetical protein
MKRIIFICLALAAVLGSVALLSSTDMRTATASQLAGTDLAYLAQVSPAAAAEAASSAYYIYPTGATSYEGDTITNTTNDTVTVPVNLLTNREGCWWVTSNNISGTTAVIAIVQETSYLGTTSSAFDWTEVGRDTTATSETMQICFNRTEGFKQRLILDGYTGTQSTRIRTKFVAKPK